MKRSAPSCRFSIVATHCCNAVQLPGGFMVLRNHPRLVREQPDTCCCRGPRWCGTCPGSCVGTWRCLGLVDSETAQPAAPRPATTPALRQTMTMNASTTSGTSVLQAAIVDRWLYGLRQNSIPPAASRFYSFHF